MPGTYSSIAFRLQFNLQTVLSLQVYLGSALHVLGIETIENACLVMLMLCVS